MAPLEDTLENIEFLLERARCAGDQEAIHCLNAQRTSVLTQINATRTKQPAPWVKYHQAADCGPNECHCTR